MRLLAFSLMLAAAVVPGTAEEGRQRVFPRISYSVDEPPRPVPWLALRTLCPSVRSWPLDEDRRTVVARGRACRERVVEEAQRSGDRRLELLALTELATMPIGDTARESRDWLDRALEITDELGELCWRVHLLLERAWLVRNIGTNIESLEESVGETRDLARAAGCTAELAAALYAVAMHPPEEEPEIEAEILAEAMALARDSDPPLFIVVATYLADRLAERGDRRALDLHEELVAMHRARGEVVQEIQATWNLGVCHAQLGDPRTAIPLLERYVEHLRNEEGEVDEWSSSFLEEVRESASNGW